MKWNDGGTEGNVPATSNHCCYCVVFLVWVFRAQRVGLENGFNIGFFYE